YICGRTRQPIAHSNVPQTSMLTGLMYYKPDDPLEYLEKCLKKVRELGGPEKVRWDTFVAQEKRALPPLNGGQGRRSFIRNVLPDSPNFPYRRFDRLPPIHQFSIESDTDLSETAELFEEYTVFDPTKPRPRIILVIGGPGSGKGTQSLKIADRYGFEYISVGELLRRKMIQNTTSNRKWSLIAKIITNGELAPQETTITEIKHRLMELPDAQGIVIDGFPRDVAQALSFEDQICVPDLVVFLACANHRLKERLEKRAEQQGRPDDNPKATQRRLTTFKQNTIPLVKYFQERSLIVTLDADRDEEEVFYDIAVTVDNKLFPTKEPVAGPSELDLSLLLDATDAVDIGSESEDQVIQYDFYCLNFIECGPGSGKRTQCERIAAKYGFTHLSTGDILRNELMLGSERSNQIKRLVERRELVPMEFVLEMLKDAMICSTNTEGFLIDGYPRDVRQGEEFEKEIAKPSMVLFMNCSADTMKTRLFKQNQTSGCVDDSGETIMKHIETYYKVTAPIIEHYKGKQLIYKINAEENPDAVFLQICEVIDSVQ
uniref:Adenylate kinase 5 n=1 Tax=Callorhinchus milii TaxID=7868 RepID=A0A4W3HWX2_CALMI